MSVAGVTSVATGAVLAHLALRVFDGDGDAVVKSTADQEPLSPKQLSLVALMTGGGPRQSSAVDEELMRRGPRGFTSWFSTDVERAMISRMQAFKNARGLGPGHTCTRVEQFTPGPYGGSQRWLGFQEAFDAVEEVLAELYPSGAPWSSSTFANLPSAEVAEREGVALWRWWLWWRAYGLAEKFVCDFRPIT